MSTSAAFTRRPIRAPANRATTISSSSRLDIIGAALTILLCAAGLACSGGGDGPLPTPAPTATAAPSSTGTDEPAARDLIDLARRFEGTAGVPRTVDLPQPAIGDVQEFDVLVLSADPEDEPSYQTLSASLRAASEHAYFFFEEGFELEQADLDAAVAAFEDRVWPVVTGAFGPPPIPGVDGDERIAILHVDLGQAIGGYISDSDTYPRAVSPHSNQREMIYLNTLSGTPGSPTYVFILAHELQHLSHLELDRDEAAWVNEGLSEFAVGLVNGSARSYGAFLDRPDTQLNAWEDVGASARHYQASSLFFEYLIEQTGGEVRDLASQQENSIAGVEAFLNQIGSTRTAAELVADWTVANFVDAPSGRYGYSELDVNPPIAFEAKESDSRQISQFAADYLLIEADHFGPGTVFEFDGAEDVPALAAQAEADGAFWWSGRGDNIDSMLTRELDLTGVTQANLTFRTWFDIEEWYDYAYVAVSEDGGDTWVTIAGRRTTEDDPIDVAYGPGYTGSSEGWVEERIDLTDYAGSVIQIRFEYVTDGALQRPGWAIDDIAVPEIGFFDGGERDVGGWDREGFRLLEGQLDQEFELRVVKLTSPPRVERVALENGSASVALTGLGPEYRSAVIIIVATTDGTLVPANYRYGVTGARETR